MRNTTIFVAVLFGTLMYSATDIVAEDEVYRWVDENGVVHFGGMPEGHKGEEKIDIQTDGNNGLGTNPGPVAKDPNTTNSPQQADPQTSVAQQRRDERAAKQREMAQRQQATDATCELARERIATLEPSPRVLVQNKDGTVDRLDDNKRLELLAESKTFVAENCNN